MNDQPLVTIGLPVYNSETYLRQSLESLLAQTYSNFVLVISDNASTDGTADICRSYASKDSRIRYHRNAENIGLPRNFNKVVELTETKYLKWSTADDYSEPTFIEKALAVMEQDPDIILCYPKTIIIDNDGENPRPYEDNLHLMEEDPSKRFRNLFSRIKLSHQALGLIRVSMLRQTHLFRTYLGSDLTIIAEMALHGKFYELPERLFYRRFHAQASSGNRGNSDHAVERYYAVNENKRSFKQWRMLHADLASVKSAPISVSEKLGLYAWLSQRFLLRQSKRFLKKAFSLRRSTAEN